MVDWWSMSESERDVMLVMAAVVVVVARWQWWHADLLEKKKVDIKRGMVMYSTPAQTAGCSTARPADSGKSQCWLHHGSAVLILPPSVAPRYWHSRVISFAPR